MPIGLKRAWRAIARWFGPAAPARPPSLPDWARVGRKRRRHIERVVDLLEEWADAMTIAAAERARWLRAAWLHDALRDARRTGGVSHGAAAADRAAREGESDRGVLDAVRYHSIGYAGWDDVVKMLFLADYLEPGRKQRRKERARLVERVPAERDAVLREVVGRHVRALVRAGRPVHPFTLEFWNKLVDR